MTAEQRAQLEPYSKLEWLDLVKLFTLLGGTMIGTTPTADPTSSFRNNFTNARCRVFNWF